MAQKGRENVCQKAIESKPEKKATSKPAKVCIWHFHWEWWVLTTSVITVLTVIVTNAALNLHILPDEDSQTGTVIILINSGGGCF